VGIDDTGKLGIITGGGGGDVTSVLAGTNINVTNSTGPEPIVNLNDFIALPATDVQIKDEGLIQIGGNTILHARGTNNIALGALALGDDGGGGGSSGGSTTVTTGEPVEPVTSVSVITTENLTSADLFDFEYFTGNWTKGEITK